MAKTRNSEVLASFVAYCEANPEQRFWQALRNWTKYNFVLVSNQPPSPWAGFEDTFYWEGKDHPKNATSE
jgi:hypothetical protein